MSSNDKESNTNLEGLFGGGNKKCAKYANQEEFIGNPLGAGNLGGNFGTGGGGGGDLPPPTQVGLFYIIDLTTTEKKQIFLEKGICPGANEGQAELILRGPFDDDQIPPDPN